MAAFSGSMRQCAVYWGPTGYHSADGEPYLSSPVQIDCRWEKRHSEVQSPNSDDDAIIAEVSSLSEMKKDAVMWLGRLDDFNLTGSVQIDDGLCEVKSVIKSTDLKGRQTLYEARLARYGKDINLSP